MNCRGMELNLFRRPAVARVLEERFVEARLHTDHDEYARLQLEMTGSLALPIYLVIDPETMQQHGRVDGALEEKFIELLETGWNSAGDKHASR